MKKYRIANEKVLVRVNEKRNLRKKQSGGDRIKTEWNIS